ncbi:hypothetical protein, partial [Acinetobacter baumannii]|uniref:hypothetical protein n=1 Tax=Acinetobacter baumannii TaxID=470 RepID=UPI002090932A
MKRLIALPFSALMVVSVQVSALCLNISESFTGIIGPGGDSVAHGPFTITGANGCSGAKYKCHGFRWRCREKSLRFYIDQEVGSFLG